MLRKLETSEVASMEIEMEEDNHSLNKSEEAKMLTSSALSFIHLLCSVIVMNIRSPFPCLGRSFLLLQLINDAIYFLLLFTSF